MYITVVNLRAHSFLPDPVHCYVERKDKNKRNKIPGRYSVFCCTGPAEDYCQRMLCMFYLKHFVWNNVLKYIVTSLGFSLCFYIICQLLSEHAVFNIECALPLSSVLILRTWFPLYRSCTSNLSFLIYSSAFRCRYKPVWTLEQPSSRTLVLLEEARGPSERKRALFHNKVAWDVPVKWHQKNS